MFLRIYHYVKPTMIFYDSSYNRFRGKPHAPDWDFKLNSRGFKDKEFTEKKPNVYRIIGIGDSFAFGVVPYKYNYLTLLASQLQQEGFNVEVLNMGIPGIGPKEYLSLLVNEGLDLKPDMLLLSFFLGNDFIDVGKRQLYTYSYVASLLYYLITVQQHYEGIVVHGTGDYCDACPGFDEKTFLETERDRSSIFLEGNHQFISLLNNAMHYLIEINNICKNKNIKFVVVIIPDELQINQELQNNVFNSYYRNIDKNKWKITLPNMLLTNELRKYGIMHLDLYNHFSQQTHRQLYRPRDTHWNIAGNQLASQVITDFLRKLFTDERRH